MNRTRFDELVAETVKQTADLLISKGAEYANDADRLANFKRNAEKNGQTVLEVWATYWGKHVDAINTYMGRVKADAINRALYAEMELAREDSAKGLIYIPSEARFRGRIDYALPYAMRAVDATLSEPIEGRFHDNINYSLLAIALLAEIKESKA